MSFTRKILILAMVLVVISSFLTEVDARRKILRGRKTITRTYYRGFEIPGWICVILTTIGIIGGNSLIYFGLKKWIIERNEPIKPNKVHEYRMEHEV